MEERSSLFGLSIDLQSKSHLTDAAKWARFLAIVGMIMLALVVAAGVFLATQIEDEYSYRRNFNFRGGSTGMGAAFAIVYLIFALVGFFPMMFLLRFANRMTAALNSNNQESLSSSFQNLKIYFRYFGIIIIIFLSLFALSLFFGVLGRIS